MTKWIFIVAGFVVALGLFFTVRYGIAPRPIPLIKPTEVQSLESAGVLVYRRMRQDIRAQNLILAGGLPLFASFEKFWQGFFLGAQNDGARFDKIITMSDMPLFQESQTVPVESLTALTGVVFEKGVRTLLYLPSTETSHLNVNGYSKLLDQRKINKVSITLHPFWVEKKQVLNAGIQCDEKNRASFLTELDCLGVKVTQQVYRKKLDPNKNYVALYRFGQSDYLAFWYQPSKR